MRSRASRRREHPVKANLITIGNGEDSTSTDHRHAREGVSDSDQIHAYDLHDQRCIVIGFGINSRSADPAAERGPATVIELRTRSADSHHCCMASAQTAAERIEFLREEEPEWILARV